MNSFIRASDALSRLCGAIAMIMLGASVAVVSHMVFVRYVLGHSTIWQTEFVIYAVIASTFIGAPYVLLHKGHVGVDLLPNMLGGAPGRMLRLVATVIAFGFCAVIAYSSGHFWWEAFSKGWKTETVWAIPLWIPLLPLPVGMAMVCVQYLAESLKPSDNRHQEGYGA
jgi:TRAP-type C4-dicarboxylate transport system permease small subunit